MKAIAPRRPWPADFPEVVVHTSLSSRDAHPAYGAAKSGDASAAIRLALDLASEAAIDALRLLVAHRDALMLPVIADETAGYNAIPDAFAHVLGDALTLPVVSGAIVQINKVGHTRAPAFQRLVTPALFAGEVNAGANYVLIDDHVGLGGTLANLRGYIESRGAVVIAMTTLTESRDARQISPRPETLLLLRERHGHQLEELWRAQFGHGLDCLTEVEAAQLCRQPSVVAIEDFLAKAAIEARRRGLEPVARE